MSDKIVLNGAFRFPTEVELYNAKKLSKLLSSFDQLSEDAYPYFGYIERKRNSLSGVKTFVPFSPYSIINKEKDFELFKGDKINILNKEEILIYTKIIKERNDFYKKRNKAKVENQKEFISKNKLLSETSQNNTNVYRNLNEEDEKNPSKLQNTFDNQDTKEFSISDNNSEVSKDIYDKNNLLNNENKEFPLPNYIDPLVLNIIDNNIISINGAIVNPGLYPLGNISNYSIIVDSLEDLQKMQIIKKLKLLIHLTLI